MRLVLCEKPTQARDLAAVLGKTGGGDGYIETREATLTWVIGHMLETAPPEVYNPEYKKWKWEHLPILPEQWVLEPRSDRKKQLRVIRKLVMKASEVVIATDAGREGELIARETLEFVNYRGKTKRLWTSSLDAKSLKKAWAALLDGRDKDGLYAAAQTRQRADWLVGMNLSRAASIALAPRGVVLSVGRVQTPTLAMVVRRDLDIENFKPRTYFEVVAHVQAANGEVVMRYAPKDDEKRLWKAEDAEAVLGRIQGASGPIQVQTQRKKSAPPALYSLNALQQDCSRRFGLTLKQTLDVAQRLYESKVITYPRSDCRTLPEEQKPDAPRILSMLAETGLLPSPIDDPLYRKTVFNTAKTNQHDHHAIIPTGEAPGNLDDLDRKIYDMIALRYAQQFLPDYIYDATVMRLDANGVPLAANGTVPVSLGWKALAGKQEGDEKEPPLPPIEDGERGTVRDAEIEKKQTKPPKPYTEGTLVADMLNIRKYVDDPRLKKILKDTSGIGTEASRPGILETLKKRGYLEEKKVGKTRQIRSTELGRRFIEVMPAPIKNPGVTAAWEDLLEGIARNEQDAAKVMDQIVQYIRQQIEYIGKADANTMNGLERKSKSAPTEKAPLDKAPDCPDCGSPMAWRKGRYGHFWGCTGFPNCKTVLQPDGTRKQAPKPEADAPKCPKCEAPMVRRKGGRSGEFWGCSKYPKCKGTRDIEKAA